MIKQSRAALAAFFMLLLLLLSSCVSGRWVQDRIQGDGSVKVVLEHCLEEGQVVHWNYDHPAALDAAELAYVLRRFRYHKPRAFKDPVLEQAFKESQAVDLADALVSALASAESWERVRFASFSRQPGLIFDVRCKTEGVIFLENANLLHIALLEINREADSSELIDPEMDISRSDPLAVSTTFTPLELPPWCEFKFDEEKKCKMPLWLIVNLDKAREARLAEEGKPGAETPESASIGRRSPESLEGRAEDPVHEALKRLKKYHEEGLIDDEEYKAKKKDLLEKVGDRG